jgi:zinc protease
MKKIVAACAVVAACFTATLQAAGEVREYTLENGMKVLVKPDHRAPVAVSQVWYKVGSSNEYNGITGISHVLEHMMFKGTKALPAGRFSAIIAANGGEENAFTSRDYTAYYQFLGSDRLEISFELEADRMRNLLLPEADFQKERQVVREERFMRTEDKPEALTYERFNAVASLNGPYRNPVIGWDEDLEALTVDDLRAWYETYYAPNNATLVVVGDVEPDAIFALAKKHFGKLKGAKPPPDKPRGEPEQRGERRLRIHAPAKVPYVLIGYPVPSLKTASEAWEPYALDVLAGILDGGASARLSSELIRKQEIAASASAGYNLTAKYQTLFMLDANPTEKHSIEEVEKALYQQIARLQQELASDAEIKRVKAQVIASKVYELDSVQQLANQMGALETVGLGWQLMDEYPEKVKAVTAEQVREVARKYLIEKHRTVAVLVPEEVGDQPQQTTQKEPSDEG